MSEQPEPYHTDQPTALDNYVHQRRTDASVARQANWQIYEQLLTETAQLLKGSEQLTQDVLHQICIEYGVVPLTALSYVHDFLATFQAYQQHEAKSEPVQEEELLFFGRNE